MALHYLSGRLNSDSRSDPEYLVNRDAGLSRGLTLLCGTVSVGVICYQITLGAGNKPFWFDEANEILNSCSSSYSVMLLHGAATQCSPAPLYYLLQKLIVGHVTISENIIYLYRAVSIVSAGLSLIFLFFGFTNYLGIAWGLLALVAMIYEGKFYQFGAENRPYMLWVCLFAATLMLVSFLAYKPWSQVAPRSKILLALLSLALTLVASGGMLQAVGFLASLSIWEGSLNVFGWARSRAVRFQLPVAAMSCGIGLYYAFQGCLQYDGGKWDLLRTGDWNLIGSVIALLFPWPASDCRDYANPCGLTTIILNFFVLVGLAAPFWLWKVRRELSDDKKFLLSVSVVSSLQIFCAIILGGLVANAHYYFIPRIFIYLTVLRAALVVCGGYLCLTYAITKWPEVVPNLSRRLQEFVLAIVALELSGFLYVKQRALLHEIVETRRTRPALTQATCPPATSSLAILNTPAASEEFKLNFIVALGERLKRCGWIPGDQTTFYVLPKYSSDEKTYDYELTGKLPPDSSVLSVFGQPLRFAP